MKSMRYWIPLGLVFAFLVGVVASPAFSKAEHAVQRDTTPSNVTVATFEGRTEYDVIIVQGDYVYITAVPRKDSDKPHELKPWAILKR